MHVKYFWIRTNYIQYTGPTTLHLPKRWDKGTANAKATCFKQMTLGISWNNHYSMIFRLFSVYQQIGKEFFNKPMDEYFSGINDVVQQNISTLKC